jgi:hypothetical protein
MPRAARETGALDEEAELTALPRRICHFLTAPKEGARAPR